MDNLRLRTPVKLYLKRYYSFIESLIPLNIPLLEAIAGSASYTEMHL
jgi:hypothetical protein